MGRIVPMALDPNPTPPEATPVAGLPAEPLSEQPGRPVARDKHRLRFQKRGPLRLLSHHDLLRTFERLLRRADVPFHRTQGFHPKPRLVFALSLPLGVVGCDEVAEIELTQPMEPAELQDRLRRHAPTGLEILGVCRVPLRTTAHVRSLSYALPVPRERLADLQPRLAAVLASEACWIDRTRPPKRRLDLRPFLRDLRLEGAAAGSTILVMDLWLTESGTARPEEVLRLLDLHDLLDAGAVLERVRLELTDELEPPSAAEPLRPVPAEGRHPPKG
jgi:radical SAM-linked protein